MGAGIIYATGLTKTTKNIADYIAKQTKADIFNLKQITRINVTDFDPVIFGTGLSMDKPMKPVVDFVANNQEALAGKKLIVFVTCKCAPEKEEGIANSISEALGIADVVLFNLKDCEMSEAGFPVAVDEFISRV